MFANNTYRGPIGAAITGVIILVVAALIAALSPVSLGAVVGILNILGWIFIIVAAIWALAILLRGVNG